jgi:hypothetical protein
VKVVVVSVGHVEWKLHFTLVYIGVNPGRTCGYMCEVSCGN